MQFDEIEPLVDKLMELPPERLAEVEDFIDFLRSRVQVKRAGASQRKSPDFPVISVGQWPADLSLHREGMYGDDGR